MIFEALKNSITLFRFRKCSVFLYMLESRERERESNGIIFKL